MLRYSKRSRPSRRKCEVLSIRNEARSDAVRSALVWRGYADPVASKQIEQIVVLARVRTLARGLRFRLAAGPQYLEYRHDFQTTRQPALSL